MTQYLYMTIADRIAKAIQEGQYQNHQKLPTETDLAVKYQTSRLTIRKAIEALQARQIVVKDRNRGTYAVIPAEKISSGSTGLAGFTEVAKEMKRHPETQVLQLASVTTVPDTVRQALKLSDGKKVWQIERLRSVDGEPMTVEQLFVPIAVLPELTETQVINSLYQQIEQQLTIGYASQELEAVTLDEQISKLLGVESGTAAFLAHTVTFSVDGYPILYDNSYYRSDKYTFHNMLYRHH